MGGYGGVGEGEGDVPGEGAGHHHAPWRSGRGRRGGVGFYSHALGPWGRDGRPRHVLLGCVGWWGGTQREASLGMPRWGKEEASSLPYRWLRAALASRAASFSLRAGVERLVVCVERR